MGFWEGRPLHTAAVREPTCGVGYDAAMSSRTTRAADLFEEIARIRRSGERAALATVVGTRGSTPGKETMRLLVRHDGSFIGTVGGGCVEADVVGAAMEAMARGRPERLTFRLTESATGQSGLMCGGELDVLVEPIGVAALFIFGAGHISQSLASIASEAGFRVTVIDDRASFACPERFPSAADVLAIECFEDSFASLEVGAGAYCVVVTRGHAHDLTCTRGALKTPAGYVGLIGSRGKVRKIVRQLASEGVLRESDVGRLHAPIGLDLGGGSHGEIAVAIVAELIAHRHQHASGLAAKHLPHAEQRTLIARATSRSHTDETAPNATLTPDLASS